MFRDDFPASILLIRCPLVRRDDYAACTAREYWRFEQSGVGYHYAWLAGDILEDNHRRLSEH